jgi:ribosome-associated heat shock protein Hsp15
LSSERSDRQRIDKWLWHARIVRTRNAASGLAQAGYVRLNGVRVTAASRAVRAGDVVTVALDGGIRVLKVVAFADRRGPATAARLLYEDVAVGPVGSTVASAIAIMLTAGAVLCGWYGMACAS